jgi:hypothetical protein
MELKSTLLIALSCFFGTAFGQVTTYPYNEDFESEGQAGTGPNCTTTYTMVAAGWTNSTTDGSEWRADVGGTISTNTGPSVDQNPGTAAGHYLYTESSTCNNVAAVLTTPEFDLSVVAGAEVSFWYHMFGATMGNLTFAITDDAGATWTDLVTLTDNVDLWQEYTANLSAYIGSTVQFRFTGDIGTSFTSDMAIDNFSVVEVLNDDAGAEALVSPTNPLTPGVQFVQATITNFGANDINNAEVNWSIDGAVQTPVTFTGPLASGATSAPIILGTFNFPLGSTDICVWTSLPNGNTDTNTSNDTLCESRCSGLSGTYAIGGGTPDYNNFTEAVNDLVNCGVSGPVVFNVAAGFYNEAIAIPPIVGMDATNTVTFDGGSSATTVITHDAIGQNATILMQGGDYFTFTNLTIQSTGTTDAWGIRLSDTTDFLNVNNCRFEMGYSAGIIDVAGINASGNPLDDVTEGNHANSCTFDNNIFSGGERAISLEGLGTSAAVFMQNMTITNNVMTNIDDYGIYIDNIDGLVIQGNRIDTLLNVGGDGIYMFDIMNFDIQENFIHAPDYGLYISDGNFDAAPTGTSLFINNMITSETDHGVYFDDVEELNVFHNSVYNITGTTGAFRCNDLINVDIRNNVFVSETDYAFESLDDISLNGNTLDYNLYWTNGTLFITDGGAQADLASWQTAQPTMNVNSVELDPAFSSSDLHMISIPANDLGDNTVGITIDIDGDSRPTGVNVDMGADEYTPLFDNASLDAIIAPTDLSCGDNATEVVVLIRNLADTIFTCPVTVEITGAVTQTLTATYNDTILFNEVDTLIMGTIDTYNGGAISMTAYTQYAGDQDLSNDTLYNATAEFIPFEPAVGGATQSCGLDSAFVWGDTTYVGSYNWYDAATGGNLVGI